MLKTKTRVGSLFLGRLSIGVIALLIAVVGLLSINRKPVQAAAPNDVIINEIMYNPAGPDENLEFLELYNTTASPINLDGWCFTDGIVLCFTSGNIIAAHDYYVISPSPSATLATYHINSNATYTTNLSNSGETVTLKDNTTPTPVTISSVTYSDAAPSWPTSPDGGGPSLELKDTSLDNSLAANWGAAEPHDDPNNPGTTIHWSPGEPNTLMVANTPTITNVSDISDVDPTESIDIVANVADADSVNLVYKVNFDADQTIAMNDDGLSNDGAASDGVYGATIPGQAASTLVRFKVEATNGDGTASNPSNNDSINYYGYAVNDPSVTSNAPIINWYISDADFDDMHTNHVNDNVYVPAVVAYGGKIFDNSLVRIKGEYSRSFPKKSYKFKLPSGHKINLAGGSNREINEFHLNSDFASMNVGRTLASWWLVEQSGAPVPDIGAARLQRNGQFEGLYIFAEKYEKEWRQEKGYTNGSLTEDWTELVSGSDVTVERDLWLAHANLDRKDPDRSEYALDDTDVPSMINYLAVHALLRNHDTALYTNMFLYFDDDTERWSPLSWDLDLLFNPYPANIISPYDTAIYMGVDSKVAFQALYDRPEMRAAFYRRLRTLADEFYANDQFLNKVNEIDALHASDSALDVAKWVAGVGDQWRSGSDYNTPQILLQKFALLAEHRNDWAIPAAQTNTDRQAISIAQVVPNATNADEYIRLSNSASTPVDISGWVLEGINYTMHAGTVIPANGSIYLLRDDKGYRAGHAAVLVAGQYTEDLDDLSPKTLTLKTNAGQEIDSYDY